MLGRGKGTYENISGERSSNIIGSIRPICRHRNDKRNTPRRTHIGNNCTEGNDKQHSMFLCPAPLPSASAYKGQIWGGRGYVKGIVGIVRGLRNENCFAIRGLFQICELSCLEAFQVGQVGVLQLVRLDTINGGSTFSSRTSVRISVPVTPRCSVSTRRL